jgi:RND family efflux transporter MFP subunit
MKRSRAGWSRAVPRWAAPIGLVLGLVLGSAQGAALAEGLIPLAPEQQKAFGIALAAPGPAGETLTRRYPAKVAVPNRQMRVVSAPQGGILSALLVAEGEQVTAGQVLAEIRSPELIETQSQYLEAVTRLALAESELKRDQMLHREGVIAERRLLESQAKQRELATQVEQRRQILALAGLSAEAIDTLTRTRALSSTLPVHAPIAGVVLEQMVSTGQAVAAAEPLYRVAQVRPLWLEIHVPVDQVAAVRAGSRVLLPELGTEGTIITIGRMVHQEDQGVLVRAEVSDGTERLRPGQFVQAQLSSSAEETGWRVPAAAVVRNAGAAYLFVAREGGFEALPVTVLAEEEKTAVVSTLPGGRLGPEDQVAVSGVVALKAAWLGASE